MLLANCERRHAAALTAGPPVMRHIPWLRAPSLQVGGGDQIYCDGVFEVPAIKPWLAIKDTKQRMAHDMTPQILHEVGAGGWPEFASSLD